MTELIEATKAKDLMRVRTLLAAAADPDEADDAGRTPLIWAALTGETQIVLTLLARQASLDLTDDSGRTALNHALSQGHEAASRALLEAGADPDNRDLLAAFQGRERESASEKDVWDKIKAVSTAVAALAIPIVLGVMGHCVNLTIEGREARAQLVELALDILRQPPESLVDSNSLYEWARDTVNAHSRNKLQVGDDSPQGIFLYGATIERLTAISQGKDPGAEEIRASASEALGFILLERARAGDAPTVRRLIKAGVDPNTADAALNTPLMYAAASNRLNTVQELLGANQLRRNAINDDGQTALHIASREGHDEIVAVLVSRGADASLRNRHGFNAFQLAAREKRVKAFRVLMTSEHATEEVLYNKELDEHRTAVRYARGQPEMEEALRRSGIKLYWEN